MACVRPAHRLWFDEKQLGRCSGLSSTWKSPVAQPAVSLGLGSPPFDFVLPPTLVRAKAGARGDPGEEQSIKDIIWLHEKGARDAGGAEKALRDYAGCAENIGNHGKA